MTGWMVRNSISKEANVDLKMCKTEGMVNTYMDIQVQCIDFFKVDVKR